jgi:oligopeptide transport system substrate-binding protein
MKTISRLLQNARGAWIAAIARTPASLAAVASLAAMLGPGASLVAPAPAHAADMNKTLRIAFQVAETGFDPQAISDLYSEFVNQHIFDALYRYDYLARPYKLVPNTAVAMPEISSDGLMWTIRIKPGIYFSDDAVFGGKKRELTANDYVYAWKRLLDPRVRSPYNYYVNEKFVGAEAVMEAAKKSGKLDYDAKIEGLQAIDRYTIRLRLVDPDYGLQHNMTQTPMAAVAREVIDKYGAEGNTWTMSNPVGTGPYLLKDWKRANKILLEANPNFRDVTFPESADPADKAIMAKMKGKKIPAIGRVEISIIEEDNPRLLSFDSGQVDYEKLPYTMTDRALVESAKGASLKPDYAQRGIGWYRVAEPGLIFAYFNMLDPVVGGYEREKIALRRAMALGFNVEELIRVSYKGQGLPATQPVPPNVAGHDPNAKAQLKYDPAQAKALLDKFGYKDCDGDGMREMPGCKPLLIQQGSATTARDREISELWKKNMDAIGIKMTFITQPWPDLLKQAKAGQLQMWRLGWFSSVADGESFLGLVYGKRIGQNNYSQFNLPEYNKLFEQATKLPDGRERTALYRKMSDIIVAYSPWHMIMNRLNNTLVHPWVLGYKQHAFYEHNWRYLDIDVPRRAATLKQ